MRDKFILTELSSAVLSDDCHHRYWLVRIWERKLPLLVVCMFNPSTADASKNDPTITNLCKFAKRWRYGGILVINLYSLRTSHPHEVRARGKEAWGEAQPNAFAHALELAKEQGTPVLVAWGNMGTLADQLPFLAAAEGIEFICLGRTASGAPKHPLARGKHRIPDDQQPEPWG